MIALASVVVMKMIMMIVNGDGDDGCIDSDNMVVMIVT